jgi:hypothetical protein
MKLMLFLDYYNKITKERKWAKEMDPDLIMLIQKEALRKAESKLQAQALADAAESLDPPPPTEEDDNLPPGWKAASDPDTQKTYYYNNKTKQTSWTRPTS